MTLEGIETIVIELLAAEEGRGLGELRAELEASGRELPCDSVVAAEVLGKVERRCGVRLPMTHSTAAAMRSVEAYAHAVLREVTGATSGADQSSGQTTPVVVVASEGSSA